MNKNLEDIYQISLVEEAGCQQKKELKKAAKNVNEAKKKEDIGFGQFQQLIAEIGKPNKQKQNIKHYC